MKDIVKFVETVQQMRATQNEYFRTRSGIALAASKKLEKEVDDMVKGAVRSPLVSQGSMFGKSLPVTRKAVYDKYNGHCAYCGLAIDIKGMQVDHLIPQRNYEWHFKNKRDIPPFLSHLSLNDLNHIDNLMPACRSCNGFKSTFHLELFRSEVQEQIKRLRQYKPTFNLAERFGLIECKSNPVVFYFETITP